MNTHEDDPCAQLLGPVYNTPLKRKQPDAADLLTPAELAAIAEREAKAMPGPWYWRCGAKHPTTLYGSRTNIVMDVTGMRGATFRFWVKGMMHKASDFFAPRKGQEHNASHASDLDHPDAQFIAHARADIPTLLRHIAALEARTPAPATDVDALLAEAEMLLAWSCSDVKDNPGAVLQTVSILSTALRETLAREQYAENVMCDTQEELDMHRAYVGDLIKERDAERARAEKAEHNECCLRAALEELGYTGTVPEGVWDALTQRAEKAEADLADLTQTTGELCPECHWRGVRDDGCEFCKAHRLEADLAAARAELGALGKKAAEAVEVAYKSGITDTSSMPGPKIIEQMWQDSTARRAALAIRVVKEAQ